MGLKKGNEIKFMIRWREWWESDIGYIIGWNVTWDIQLSEKIVKDDVKIANRWKICEKGAQMFKLGFLLGTMRTQERPCVCKIHHVYAEKILWMHKLKNKYTNARIDLCSHESRLRTWEQVYAHKPEFAHARTSTEGCSSTFSNFSQPKLNLDIFLPLLECQVFI